MTVNLAWRDAMSEVGGAFNKAEQSAGWAESFTTWQVAVLQRPWKRGDREGKQACQALFATLADACRDGSLQHSTWTEAKPDVQQAMTNALIQRHQSLTWETYTGPETEGQRRERLWRAAHAPVIKTKEVTHTTITAEAFAAWLAANEIEPSPHVTAWFDAVGAGSLRLVEDAIDTDSELHKAWMAEAKRGKIRAALLLGVVLWAIAGDEPSPQTDHSIVEGWAEKLIAATVEKWSSGRAVCPLNPVTLIEIEGRPKGLKWVMTIEDADAFLEAHALAFKCSDVLAYWRGEPSPYSEKPTTAPAASAKPQPDEHKPEVRKKDALIRELQGEWTSIRNDLSEASRNGLDAAKVRHGFWDVQKVKDWGKSRGKLSKPATVHPLHAPWPAERVTRHRAGD